MSGRSRPRTLGSALERVRAQAEPRTLLGAVQSAWGQAAGAVVAAEAEPVAERDGVVVIACRSATWAQELDLLQVELLERLNRALSAPSSEPERPTVSGLRFTADAGERF